MAVKIVVLGSSSINIKGYPEGEFNPEKDNFGRIEISYGGSGKKMAEYLGDLNITPNFITTINNNVLGSDLKSKLDESGVDTNYLLPVNSGGMIKTMTLIDDKGDLRSQIIEKPDISHLEKYIQKYGEKFSREFDVLLMELELSKKIMKKVITSFKKNKKKIYIYSTNLTQEDIDYSIFEGVECLLLNEKSAGILMGCEVSEMEIHQIQKTFKEFIMNNSIRRGIIVLHNRGTVLYDNVLNQSSFIEAHNERLVKLFSENELLFSSVVSELLKGVDLRNAVTQEDIGK